MSSTSGTVRALAERLAQDDNLRARLVNDPQGVLDEWGLPAGADVVPGTVTLPSVAELSGLVTASEERPHERRGPEEPEIYLGEGKPEIHLAEEPEIHLGEPKPEIHLVEEPEIHLGEDKPEIHLAEEPEVHGTEEPEVHGAETEVHITEEPDVHIAEEPDVHIADADADEDEDD
jgi:hypothetical protein